MRHFKNRARFVSSLLIFTFTMLLCQELLWVKVTQAADSPTQLLNNGIEQYNNAEFELAVEWLQQAIKAGLKTKSEQISALKYYAFCLTALGKTEEAKTQFQKALDVDPEFQLSISESPRLLDVFNEAKSTWTPQDRQSPEIDFTAPTAVDEKTPLTLTARITDATGLAAVELYYKATAAGKYKKLPMTAGTGNTYTAAIVADEVNVEGLQLYIKAADTAGNPPAYAGSEKEPLLIAVNMVDIDPPVIEHEVVTRAQENNKIEIQASIIDRSGVANASLFYRVTGEAQYKQVEMKHRGDNLYLADIPEKDVKINGLEYYLAATDKAKNEQSFKGNVKQPFAIKITMLDEQPPVIKHEPVAEAVGKSEIKIVAAVIDRSGVQSVTLYFQSPGDKTFQTIAMQGAGDEYSATIPADKVKPDALAYYLEARDKTGNAPAFAGTADKPFTIKVKPLPAAPQPQVAQAEPVKQEQVTKPQETPEKDKQAKPADIKEKKGGFPWLWVGLGTVAVGGGAAALLMGGDDKDTTPANGTLVVEISKNP